MYNPGEVERITRMCIERVVCESMTPEERIDGAICPYCRGKLRILLESYRSRRIRVLVEGGGLGSFRIIVRYEEV